MGAVRRHIGRVPGELVWAALDCPQLWSLMVHVPASTPDLGDHGLPDPRRHRGGDDLASRTW
jgi:hypothetical protein